MRLIALVLIIFVLVIAMVLVEGKSSDSSPAIEVNQAPEMQVTAETESELEETEEPSVDDGTVRQVKVMASGDMLYHDLLFWSAYDAENDRYDFHDNYEYITPLIQSADLALGDFEGTISDEFPLSGYPLFNAPAEVVPAIRAAGYDAITLAHNHILDSHLSGLLNTARLFEAAGLDVFGVSTGEDRILIKEVNGIKIALLGYAYGFNGMEGLLTPEEYNTYLKDLDLAKVKAEIEKAETLADVTIVMPQTGVEYALSPSEEQMSIYRQMIDWGADVIFGGHPHVVQPTEIIQKDGYDKFILYSMGNLISNQRIETLDNKWTERGVIMEVNLKKTGNGPVIIEQIEPHVTWVNRTPNGRYHHDGTPLYLYQTYVASDFIAGGQHADKVDDVTRERITQAHQETLELLNLQPLHGLKE